MSDIRYIGYFLQKAHRASPSVVFFVESEPEKEKKKYEATVICWNRKCIPPGNA